MKKIDLFLRLTLSATLMVCFAAKSFATTDDTQTLDVDINAVVTPVFEAAATTITPTNVDFPATRADTPRNSNTTRNTLVVGTGTVGSSTSYVLTNDETTATALSYTIGANIGDGTTSAVITDNTTNAILTLNNGASSVALFMVNNNTANAYPKLGGVSFGVTDGKLAIATSQTVDFTGIEAALEMTLDLNENSLTYAGDAPNDYQFTLTLTAVGI